MKTVRLHIYDGDLHLITRKRDQKKIRKMYPDTPFEKWASQGRTDFLQHSRTYENVHVVWVDMRNPVHENEGHLLNTCAHEASHVADSVLNHAGVGDEEARAYLVGWVTQWLWENVNKETP